MLNDRGFVSKIKIMRIADEVRQHNEMLAQRAERRAAREARRNAENAA